MPSAVYHGPTQFLPSQDDPYADAKALGIFHEVSEHEYAHINAGEITARVLRNRVEYEKRQAAKGVKSHAEEALLRREQGGG